jgi:hypothetical protein
VPEQAKVFISYRRDDARHVAGRLADRLDEHFRVFMDIDTIEPGTDFSAAVRSAIIDCDVLLALIGSQWTTVVDDQGHRRLEDPHDWVAEEIRVALLRDTRVIPVLIDGARMPSADLLPASLRPLATRQALPLRHESFTSDSARLIEVIERTKAAARAAAEAGSKPMAAQPVVAEPAAAEPAAAQPVGRQPDLYADAEYGAALSALFAEDWSSAVTQLTRVLGRYPGHPAVTERLELARSQQHLAELDGRAALAAGQRRWPAAVDALEELLALAPAYPDARARLETARHRQRISQLVADIRGLAAAGQWERVSAAGSELAAIEPTAADPDGLVTRAAQVMQRSRWQPTPAGTSGVAAGGSPGGTSAPPAGGSPAEASTTAPGGGPIAARFSGPAWTTPTGGGADGPAEVRPRRRYGWWLLAAVSVAVLIVAGIVVANYVGGGTGGSASGDTAPTTHTSRSSGGHSVTQANPARTELLGHVPEGTRGSCADLDLDQASRAGSRAAVICVPAGGHPGHVQYMLYDSPDAMLKAYRIRVPDGTGPSDCTTDPGENTYTKPTPSQTGRLGCYESAQGNRLLAWTDDTTNICAVAWDPHMSFAELKQWWQTEAGPI